MVANKRALRGRGGEEGQYVLLGLSLGRLGAKDAGAGLCLGSVTGERSVKRSPQDRGEEGGEVPRGGGVGCNSRIVSLGKDKDLLQGVYDAHAPPAGHRSAGRGLPHGIARENSRPLHFLPRTGKTQWRGRRVSEKDETEAGLAAKSASSLCARFRRGRRRRQPEMLESLLSNFHLPVSSLREAPAKKQSKGRDAVSHARCLDLGDGRLSGRNERL